MDALPVLQARWNLLMPHLDERQRRLLAAAEAQVLGYGGVALVAKASGLSRTTIHKALEELQGEPLPYGHVRRPGAGRKRLQEQEPGLLVALEKLIAPSTRGDPMSTLLWTCKSTRNLAQTLTEQGYTISHTVVAELLQELGYSLQGNAKTVEGKQHPDRDAQFQYINRQTQRQLSQKYPAISVDAVPYLAPITFSVLDCRIAIRVADCSCTENLVKAATPYLAQR